MGKILVISEKEVRECLTMSMAIKAVESAYVQKTIGEGELFPLICHDFIPGKADMDIKSGSAKSSGIFGLKLVSWFGDNVQLGLPALCGTVLLFDHCTGVPLALLNASGITGMRTGAAGAVGAKYLARPDSRTMLMVGCGAQAPYQIAAMLTAMEHVDKIYLYDPTDSQGAAKRLDTIREAVEGILSADARAGAARETLAPSGHRPAQGISEVQSLRPAQEALAVREGKGRAGYELVPVTDIESAVGDSDLIVTATPSRKPLIHRKWVRPGTHLSCMGADMKGKQELDPQLLTQARVFADDLEQAGTVGECEIAVAKGLLSKGNIHELGHVIHRTMAGRQSDTDVTVFDSSGIALQDLIVSKEILDRAKARGLGTWVEL